MLEFFPRRLTTLALAVVAIAALTPLAQASAATAPIGRMDTISYTGASVTLRGWALDPAHRSVASAVLVTVDNRPSGTWRIADLPRPDVDKAHLATGGHGFNIVIRLPDGTHQVCMSVRPVNSGNPVATLGCATVHIAVGASVAASGAVATDAQFRAEIQRIDPGHTVTWSFSPAFGSEAGWTVGNRVNISKGLAAAWLRPIVTHEWSHVLQYRAFGANPAYSMNAAVASFNAVAGTTGSYGIEHGADCMALSLGATKLGYGCPASLKVFGSRIAHGLNMTKLIGASTGVTTSGAMIRTTGWVFDPANPRKSSAIRITDHGKPLTGWITTNGVSPSVDKSYGIPGRHGYTVSVRLKAGKHLLCVTAKHLVGADTVNLRCWTQVTR